MTTLAKPRMQPMQPVSRVLPPIAAQQMRGIYGQQNAQALQQAAGGGQQAAGQQQSQQAAIQPQTSITVPENLYSPRQTQAATNQAIASQHAAGDVHQIMKQFDRPGVSRSAGSVAAALPQAVQANVAAAQAGTRIPLLDAIANSQHILGAETAREQEATGWGGLGMRLLEGQGRHEEAYQNAMLQPLLTLLAALGLE